MSAVCSLALACGGDGETADDDAATHTVIDAAIKDSGASSGGHGDGAVSTVGSGLDAAVASGQTSLSGTLGALGAVLPTVSSLVITNSGETLIYLSSAPLTCDLLSMSRWLGSAASGSQVVELVVSGAAKLGAAKDPEANYAPGGKSSAYEKNAKTASVTFTRADPMGVVEGTVTATYASPTGDLTGSFHAEYCPNGQDY